MEIVKLQLLRRRVMSQYADFISTLATIYDVHNEDTLRIQELSLQKVQLL